MVKINETETILSRNELHVLIGTAMCLAIKASVMTEEQVDIIVGCTSDAEKIIEGHIWGNEKIPSEFLAQAWMMSQTHGLLDREQNPDQEDKQAICKLLLAALQKTRAYHDLVDLKYDHATVTAKFASCGTHQINVEADSGIAMINNILAHI